jgi:ATP-dependent helicase/nuclease subunit B
VLIRFGLHLDGMQMPAPDTAVGVATLGPQGLLDVLETQLGLPPVLATAADALMAYRACLAEVDDPARFYHRSFELDPINVARTLLQWRADWYEHGWNGVFAADAPQRLRDLAAVEALAATAVPLTRGQRVQRATAALRVRKTQIERMEMLDPWDELPQPWRVLLNELGCTGAAAAMVSPRAAVGTDLRTVQDTLARLAASPDGERSGKIQLQRDGSFVVLRGSSRDITAQAVAEHCRGAAAPDEVLVIAERDGIIVDNAFERTGLPRAGFAHYSRFRAVTQVLKLALSLLWRPVSPHLLLQFLIHPVGPLRPRVRDELAAAVAEQPGIGGRAWRDALARIEARLTNEGAGAKDIETLRTTITTWLAGERFDPAAGAPVDALTGRTQLCTRYLIARLSNLDDAGEQVLYRAALAQADALGRALRSLAEQGQARVTRIELDRLIDEVSGLAPDPNAVAQARHVCAANHPATVAREFGRVYWWDLSAPSQEIGYPWSRKELSALRADGIALPTVADLLRIRTRQWLRPILHAREQLLLIVHDSEHGYHPLWTQVTNLFDAVTEVRVDAALLHGAMATQIGIPTRSLPEQRLPAPRRWWQLPADVAIPRRDVESYSSLAKLFDYPHGYVLRYQARLKAGRAQELVDGNRLYGNLAHALFERFFTENPLWPMQDAAAVQAWFAATLPVLLEAEGAVLLEPGRGVDKQQVTTTLERALVALLEHLHDAGIEAVRPEFFAEAPFDSIRLQGEIDLLLTDRSGREVVLDVKWGGEAYRAKELDGDRHLQLATYAYLRRSGKTFPYQAFFIIESGHILAPDVSVFPDAVTHGDAAAVTGLWQRMAASYEWRRQQLDAGCIEVNVAATQPTPASMAPPHALATTTEPDNFDDFTHLTGWHDYQ